MHVDMRARDHRAAHATHRTWRATPLHHRAHNRKVRKSNFYADAALHMRNFKQLVKKTATEELVDGGGGGGGGEYGTFYSDRLLCPDSDDFFSNR